MSSNTHPRNPFARGFNNLRIERLLSILYDAHAPLPYLPPHPSQQHWSDQQLERYPCPFNWSRYCTRPRKPMCGY